MPSACAVPTIDVAGWAGGDHELRSRIATAVDDACRRVGFMQIVGHGIPDQVVDGLATAIDRFFGLPLPDKRRYLPPSPDVNRGYTAPRSERLSYSLGVDSPDDLFEAFNVGASRSQFPALDLDGLIYAENIWPRDVPGFRTGVGTWFDHAGAMARTMTDIFALALGLPDGYFRRYTTTRTPTACGWSPTNWGWAPTPTTASSPSCGRIRCPGWRSSDPTARGCRSCRRRVRC
jgi:isopenicillin N synthase-like dioxygenase